MWSHQIVQEKENLNVPVKFKDKNTIMKQPQIH